MSRDTAVTGFTSLDAAVPFGKEDKQKQICCSDFGRLYPCVTCTVTFDESLVSLMFLISLVMMLGFMPLFIVDDLLK